MNEKPSSILKFFSLSTPLKGAIRYPVNQTIFGSYILFFKNFKRFCYIGCLFAFVISLIYIFGGESLYCYLGQLGYENICSFSLLAFIAVRIVILYLISVFAVRYYQIMWQDKPLSLKQLFKPLFLDVRSFLSSIVFFTINSIALISWYLLKIRIPNPDWRIELCYFGVVSIGFLVPFILLRFYPLLASIWSGNKIPDIWNIWQKSRGNNMLLILSIGLWVFLWSFSSSVLFREIEAVSAQLSYWGLFLGEYIYNFMFLAIISCFINNCALQYSFLQEDNSNE